MQIVKKLCGVIVGSVFLLSACAFAQMDIQENQDIGQAAVTRVFDAYSRYSLAGFEAVVSENFAPLRGEFMETVDTAAASQQAVMFDFSIDQALLTGSRLAVTFKWYKKFTIPGVSGQQKAQGTAEFIFAREDGQWKLATIRGDNPF